MYNKCLERLPSFRVVNVLLKASLTIYHNKKYGTIYNYACKVILTVYQYCAESNCDDHLNVLGIQRNALPELRGRVKCIKDEKDFTAKEQQKTIESSGFVKNILVPARALTYHRYNKNLVNGLRWLLENTVSTDNFIDPEI